MASNNNVSRLTIDLSKEDHKKLKATAAILSKSMRELVLEAVEQYLLNIRTSSNFSALTKGFDLLAKDKST